MDLTDTPHHDTMYEHTSGGNQLRLGKTLAGSLRTYISYPFRLMCFVRHHHEKNVSIQMKYFITKRQKQKKLRVNCTGKVRFPTAVLPSGPSSDRESEGHHCMSTDGPNQNSIF